MARVQFSIWKRIVSGRKLIDVRHEGHFDNNYRPAGQLLCWLKNPQPTEEFKDGQKSDYTLTEKSI